MENKLSEMEKRLIALRLRDYKIRRVLEKQDQLEVIEEALSLYIADIEEED